MGAAGNLVMEDIRQAIIEAERELEAAEKAVASKRSALMVLQKQLQDQLMKNVGGLKDVTLGGDKVKKPETEEERRARVRRRWRVLALKVKFGLGANVLAVNKRRSDGLGRKMHEKKGGQTALPARWRSSRLC